MIQPEGHPDDPEIELACLVDQDDDGQWVIISPRGADWDTDAYVRAREAVTLEDWR